MKLGAQMYTLREYCKTPEALLDSLKKVKAMGYNAVQLSGHGKDIDDDFIANALKETGLACAATHVDFNDILADVPAMIAKHKKWGCEYVGIGGYSTTTDTCGEFIQAVNRVVPQLEDAGLHFLYHNHHREFRKNKNGVCLYEKLLEGFEPRAQFELDTFWVQRAGCDVVAWIRRLEGRMDVVHFKDMTLDEKCDIQMAEIGQGNLNWDGITEACEDIGVKWVLVEQDECQRCPFESLEISRKFCNSLGIL